MWCMSHGMSRLEAAERVLGEAEQRATMSRLEAAERALGEAEQRATTASALSASRESERTVNELIAKHAPRGLRLHWEQQQPSGRAACELVMWQRVRSSWSAPSLSCWGPQPTPGRTGNRASVKHFCVCVDSSVVEFRLLRHTWSPYANGAAQTSGRYIDISVLESE